MTTFLKAILVIMVSANLALSGKVPARSQETHIRVQNYADEDIITTIVTDIDGFDWENGKGPTANFQDVYIKKLEAVDRREEVNYYASNCPFTMTLVFKDGKRESFRINQKYAIGDAKADFQRFEGSRTLTYDRVGGNTLQITFSV